MKNIPQMLLAALMISTTFIVEPSQAWVSTPESSKEHHFVYRFKAHSSAPVETYEISMAGASYEDAYERAASACYRHFRDNVKSTASKRHLSEDQGLSIIDTCANPRSL